MSTPSATHPQEEGDLGMGALGGVTVQADSLGMGVVGAGSWGCSPWQPLTEGKQHRCAVHLPCMGCAQNGDGMDAASSPDPLWKLPSRNSWLQGIPVA